MMNNVSIALNTPEFFRGSVVNTHAMVVPVSDALASFPDAVILANAESRVTYLNPAAEKLLGMPLEILRGCLLDEALVLQDRVTLRPVQVQDFLCHPTPFDGAFHLLLRCGGGAIPVQYSVAVSRDEESGAAVGYIVSLRDVSGLQRYIDKLVTQSMHDEHTRLLRRAELVKRLWRLLKEPGSGEPHALMYLDLDNFKSVTDQAGHAAGDLAIRQIAARFKDVVRGRDTLARLGGDEFGLLMERCPVERARECAAQMHQAVESYVLRWNGESYNLGVSIGIALFNTPRHSLNTILAAADAACYQARREPGIGMRIRETVLD
ncbi:MAG: diguanylate cyclase [Thiobacillus sp.]|nr:diguanylate cyclase [Thiobacillus sp.]